MLKHPVPLCDLMMCYGPPLVIMKHILNPSVCQNSKHSCWNTFGFQANPHTKDAHQRCSIETQPKSCVSWTAAKSLSLGKQRAKGTGMFSVTMGGQAHRILSKRARDPWCGHVNGEAPPTPATHPAYLSTYSAQHNPGRGGRCIQWAVEPVLIICIWTFNQQLLQALVIGKQSQAEAQTPTVFMFLRCCLDFLADPLS